MTLEKWAHLIACLEAVLGVGKEVRPRLLQGGAMADRDQHVMQPAPLADVVVHLVGGHDRRAAPLRHRGPPLQHPGILWAQVVMELAEHTVLAEGLLEPMQCLLFIGGAEVEEIAPVLGHSCQWRPRLALGLVGVSEADQPAEIGVAAQVAGDQ